jgi:riboflavin biosynthesis pyrimidine reductase
MNAPAGRGVSVAQQAVAAELVDEVVLHVGPVLLGRGARLFDTARTGLRCIETINGEGATHLRYAVLR